MMYPEGNRLLPDDVLLQLGMAAGNVGLRTPYFMSAPWFLAETDLVICLPRRAALKLANAADLQVVPLPESPRFSFGLLWHERVHRDPGMRWFRDWIVTADDPSRQAQGQAARSERRR